MEQKRGQLGNDTERKPWE